MNEDTRTAEIRGPKGSAVSRGLGCGMIFGIPLALFGTLAEKEWHLSGILSLRFLGSLLFTVMLFSIGGVLWEVLVLRHERRSQDRVTTEETDVPRDQA